MRKFRIHNDIPITWRIVDKQTLLPFDLEGKTIRLSLQTRFGMISIEDFTVSDNVISFVFKASQQSALGVYTATASITDAEGHTWTMDACQMLELVSQSCCADVCGSHGVDETSGVEFQQVIFVDSELNAESENPVSNSAVTKAIQGIKSDTLIIDEKINIEIEERKDSDNSLGERIESSVASLENLILGEREAREEADNALLDKINLETDERKEAESLLYNRIKEESNKREEEDNILNEIISEEVEARKAADLATGDRINTLSDKAVQTTKQNFSEEQKAQARENIGVPSKVGYYPKMSVGFSENISGDGSAVDAEFSFRPTAGENRNILNDGAARIKSIKGNSLVWNQLSASISEIAAHRSYYFDFDGVNMFTVKKDGGSSGLSLDLTLDKRFSVLNHYYLFIVEGSTVNDIVVYAGSKYLKLTDGWVIVQCTIANGNFYIFPFGVNNDIVAGTTFTLDSVKLIDLTQMFGSGNEPSTIEDFHAQIPSNIDMYAYNEGEIINNNVEGIKTVGFNQWDEEWEVGSLNETSGEIYPNKSKIRSKNFIKVIPNLNYYSIAPVKGLNWCLYDEEKNHVGSWFGQDKDFDPEHAPQFLGWYAGTIRKMPNGVRYVKFSTWNDTVTTYNHDICINLSWPEYAHLNGTYQPYKPFSLDLSWVKKYFPDGMKSAGNVRDEIRWDSSLQKWVAVQNVGVVDMGTLKWDYYESIYGKQGGFMVLRFFEMALQNSQSEIANLTCTSYPTCALVDALSNQLDKTITGSNSDPTRLIIYDSTYSDNTTFRSAMQGVMLYYELAEPIETEIEEDNLNFDYDVEDFGTEEAISDEPSAPFRADIVYQPNALATIKNVPDLIARISALEQALASIRSTQVEEKVIE